MKFTLTGPTIDFVVPPFSLFWTFLERPKSQTTHSSVFSLSNTFLADKSLFRFYLFLFLFLLLTQSFLIFKKWKWKQLEKYFIIYFERKDFTCELNYFCEDDQFPNKFDKGILSFVSLLQHFFCCKPNLLHFLLQWTLFRFVFFFVLWFDLIWFFFKKIISF